jgi:hypothetical protein
MAMKELYDLLVLLFPGFLVIFILTFLTRDVDWKRDVFGAFAYSLIINNCVEAIGHTSITQLSWLAEFISQHAFVCKTVFAILVALLTVWILSFRCVRKFIIKTRSELLMTAWDATWKRMSLLEKPVFCEIYLKDEQIPVIGIFSGDSVASMSYRKDGIFLEKVLSYEGESLKIDETSSGIFIPHEQIRYIKFYKMED